MREGLHYKNERSLAFSIFLHRMQKMFNIYKEEGEEFTENAKLHELFKWVQHPQLQDTIKALKVCFDMEGITYTQAANHRTSTTSLARSQLHHLEHQGFEEVGVAVTTAMLKRRGNTSPEQRHRHVRWIGFYWALPELVRTVKRRQAAGVGFTEQEEERRCWQQVTNFRHRIHHRAVTSHEAYHFGVGVIEEQSNQQRIQ